jgi:hypothetical protein
VLAISGTVSHTLSLSTTLALIHSKSQASLTTTAARSITTLQETLAAQVPEKQKRMAQLKKEHGDHVYVLIMRLCLYLSGSDVVRLDVVGSVLLSIFLGP